MNPPSVTAAPASRPADGARLEPAGDPRDLVVVVDDDPVMEFWADEVSTFVAVLRAQPAFGSVEVWRMAAEDGALRVTGRPDDGPLAPVDLIDHSGRRVVFLLTHSGSDAWRSGLVHPVLASWAASMTVAVVHLLPQQRWRERGLETTGVTWSPDGSGSARLSWRVSGLDLRPLEEQDDARLTAVPVIERGTDWLQRWSRLLGGRGDVWMPALLLPPEGLTVRRPGRSLTAHDLVARFRATVSPASFTLATRLAAAPLNARVVRALLHTVVRSGPAQLTEVLTSDLVRPLPYRGAAAGDTRIGYEFVHGVRERLLTLGFRDRTVEVQHVVEYELAHDIEAVRNLTLRIKDPRNASYERVTPAAEPYLRVELAVHLSLGGPNLIAAARLGQALGSPIPRQVRRTLQPSSVTDHRTMESGMSDRVNSPGSGVSFGTTPHATLDAEPGIISSRPPTHDLPSAQRLDGHFPAVVGNLPLRNTNFTGRRDLLDSLHQRLRAGTTAVLPEALHGAGGVGKSQLVVEYVYLHQQDFDLIWWIPAERPAQIQSALVELAARLDLPVPSTANTAVPAVLEALRIGRPYSNWLLIFDNAENPEDVERFFPKGGPGSIVVTSRNGAWREVANSLPVDVFERRESIELLRRRGPDLAVDDADRLAAALGDLPLAVEQAAAWRAETQMPANEYLELLDASRPALDEETAQQDYPELVAAAWNVSLNWLREQDRSALRLLQVCAFFAPEPIGKVLLSKPRALRIHPDLDPLVRNPIRLNRAIRTIGRLSLARIDHRTNSFQMHRLVQRVLINQMDPDDRDAMRHGAHMLLAGNDPDQPDDADHWPRYAELYPHIVASGAEQCGNELVRDMVLNEAKYLWRWGDHLGARDLSQRAWRAWTASTDGTDPDGLRMASWLGFMHFVVGDYAAAATLNAQTLELYRQTVGEDQEETLYAIGAVAADHRVAGDFAGALDRALTVYERAKQNFGDEEPFTLRAAHNLAVSMRLSGLFGRALQLDEQTYQRLVQIYGTDHPDSLSTFGGINLDRRELGDYVAAHAHQENVVATARRMLKYDDHPDLLRQSHMLASFRRKAGHHHDALDLSSDVLRRFRTRYGDDHPDTALATLTFSIDQRLTGDLRAAREAAEVAVEGLRRLYGEDHPHTAGAQVDLAVTLRLLGEADQARELDQAALQRLATALGDSHALVLAARINLASDHYEVGDYAQAEALDVDTLALCRQMLGSSHPTTLVCALNLAMDLRDLGREAEAGALFDRGIEQLRQTLGVRHPAVAAVGAGVRANCDIDPLPL
ncbi:FxSxx-COOH system tetratricopeptide repeat protein [Micromonospora sp. WMMD812]|uniref:FxSxx-COOH system tetratricopeptide repeat protein n=1 Tax=Micromonospora sp. WMMD812 TaxID=3015152 RepID=UPI00248BBDE8|nr:FxSxx-COOH system tetratricopeptide repeat protein [Micromonospora sp. WMMD812]WBB68302.1 FxSxx-COOH system tetratricopeptide repeat protein [Micromonospora sp. WMMD812]